MHPHRRRPQRGRPGGHHATSGMGGPPPQCGPGPPPPLHPPSPPPVAPGHPPPGLGRRRPLPTPPLPPPPHQEGGGQGQGEGKGHQGALRQEGTEGAPSESRHSQGQDVARDTTWGQETTQEPRRGGSGDQGTEEKGTTANATTHTQEGHTTTGGPAPPHPHRTPHDSLGRTPQHTPPKQASDAVRSRQRTPTSQRKPHGEWRAHQHGENGPHPQTKPQGTPPHGAPPRPHRQATTPAATRATSQAPEEDEGTATATRTRDRNPPRTRDQGAGPLGGQPHGPSSDRPTRPTIPSGTPKPPQHGPSETPTPNRTPQPPASHTPARTPHHDTGQADLH